MLLVVEVKVRLQLEHGYYGVISDSSTLELSLCTHCRAITFHTPRDSGEQCALLAFLYTRLLAQESVIAGLRKETLQRFYADQIMYLV